MKPYRRALARWLLAAPAGLAIGACSSRGAPPKLEPLASIPKSVSRWRWSVRGGRAGFGFAPSVYEGQVRAASVNGKVLTIDGPSGRRLKTIDTGRPLASGIASDGEIIVLSDTEGQLLTFTTDGKLRWSTDMGAESASLPAIGGGVVVMRQSNNAIAAYGLVDGKRRWLYTRRNPTLVLRQTSGIVVDEQVAYVGLPGGRMVALALSTGASKWDAGISLPRGSNEIERIADVVATPVIGGPTLCAAAYQGRVTCLDRESGRALWSSPLRAGSGIDLDEERIVIADVDGKLLAFARTGEPAWEQEALRGRQLSPPLLRDDHVWVGDANGFIHTLDATSGKLVGRVPTDGSQIVSQPVAFDTQGSRIVLVQTTAGTIAAASL